MQIKKTNIVLLFACIALVLPVMASSAEQNISKFLLIKLTRQSSATLCSTPEFTQCMGFAQERCNELSESAIETCLAPLPDSIKADELENDSLEACPQKVYSDAGFSEEKAKMCFDVAMEASQKAKAAKPVENQ